MPPSCPSRSEMPFPDRRAGVLRWQAAQSHEGTYLELVEESDAGFIFECRTSPHLNAFLSPPPPSLKHQGDWIRDYKIREELGMEFYFIIKNKKQSLGAVRLYDFQDKRSFTWGSWIVIQGAPLRTAYRSAELVYQIGFDVLDFDRATFTVDNRNTRVIAFHNRMGSIPTHETAEETIFVHHRPPRLLDDAPSPDA